MRVLQTKGKEVSLTLSSWDGVTDFAVLAKVFMGGFDYTRPFGMCHLSTEGRGGHRVADGWVSQ